MQIAELFVNLGVKGDAQAAKALKETKTSIDQIGSSAVASKAALLAVVYGLDRMVAGAGERSMGLKQFAGATGLGAEMLQRWQVAAMNFGVSADEVESSIKGVQSAMTAMVVEGANPKAMRMFEELAGGIDPKRLNDIPYILEKIQLAIKKAPPNMARFLAPSVGLSDNMQQFMRGMDPASLAKIPRSMLLSDSEIARGARMEAMWTKLGYSMKLFGERTAIKYGPNAIQDMTRAFQVVVDASKGLSALTKEFPKVAAAGVAAGLAIGAAWAPLTATIIGITTLLSEYQLKKEGKPNIFGEGKLYKELPSGLSFGDDIMNFLSGSIDNPDSAAGMLFGGNSFLNGSNDSKAIKDHHISPRPKPPPPAPAHKAGAKVSQNLYFQHSGENHRDNARSHKEAVELAMRSSSVLSGGV